ncbi:hypothetical protein SS05631_a45490 (plasmid) [Sinorhizobium sp. CCBAU 05631]|uniref:Uncharacterized protein n=1 Tax=Sinorhizobium fredii (strain USDA 257) TaxID=1185652 RepID=I3XGI4_SINF2|nr:hypothetical protein USDA257_p02750 [Sinorhizobium fredii USDA 257]ASY60932.1 hypothetical protein SS05631_a45490 [Sinorhizobium sp. CCBAU 05631]AWI62096.1 hypothetical protein AB395_00004572 [Sinorhizobium fredii CCBAU 45436]CCE98795.1 hypothetical protein SFHH103_04315 [Sinorhizobium fredii HH103]CEO91533.1 hypothetical protein SFHH103_psfHH103d_334 [Sinorhizobium fredii HH103]
MRSGLTLALSHRTYLDYPRSRLVSCAFAASSLANVQATAAGEAR